MTHRIAITLDMFRRLVEGELVRVRGVELILEDIGCTVMLNTVARTFESQLGVTSPCRPQLDVCELKNAEDAMAKEAMVLTPDHVLCGPHGEIFKARWPVGYVEFCSISLDALKYSHNFSSAVDAHTAATGVGVTKAIEHFLAINPICCRLTDEILLEIFGMIDKAVHPWERDACELCGKRRLGCAYRMQRPTACSGPEVAQYRHVCLHCVVHRRVRWR